MAKKIIKISKSKSSIVFKPLPENDPKIRQPDISVAKEILGWEPEVDVELGLEKTIEGFRERMDVSEPGKF